MPEPQQLDAVLVLASAQTTYTLAYTVKNFKKWNKF
jgi:hypothetical protein